MRPRSSSQGATIGAGAKIGPYCVVGPDVSLAEGVELVSHVVVAGRTTIGAGTRIFPFASIGHQPQDLKYKGEPSTLTVGANCIIREGVTMNPGTEGGGMSTTVGDGCAFLANSHVGHDCHVGSNVILSEQRHARRARARWATSRSSAAARRSSSSPASARTRSSAACRAWSTISFPTGWRSATARYLSGLNIIGLQRRGFSRSEIHDMRRAYRALFAAEGTLLERVEDVALEFKSHPIVIEIVEFIRAGGKRSICTPREAGEA